MIDSLSYCRSPDVGQFDVYDRRLACGESRPMDEWAGAVFAAGSR